MKNEAELKRALRKADAETCKIALSCATGASNPKHWKNEDEIKALCNLLKGYTTVDILKSHRVILSLWHGETETYKTEMLELLFQ